MPRSPNRSNKSCHGARQIFGARAIAKAWAPGADSHKTKRPPSSRAGALFLHSTVFSPDAINCAQRPCRDIQPIPSPCAGAVVAGLALEKEDCGEESVMGVGSENSRADALHGPVFWRSLFARARPSEKKPDKKMACDAGSEEFSSRIFRIRPKKHTASAQNVFFSPWRMGGFTRPPRLMLNCHLA